MYTKYQVTIIAVLLFFLNNMSSFAENKNVLKFVQQEVLNIGIGNAKSEILYSDFKGDEDSVAERRGVDSFIVDNDGKIYLVNGIDSRIKVYKDNKFIESIDFHDTFIPIDIEIDRTTNMMFLLLLDGRVIKMTLKGEIVNILNIPFSLEEKNKPEIEKMLGKILRGLTCDENGKVNVYYEGGYYYNIEHPIKDEIDLTKLSSYSAIYSKVYVTPTKEESKNCKKYLGNDKDGNYYFLITRIITNAAGEIEISEAVNKYNKSFRYLASVPLVESSSEVMVGNKYIYLSKDGGIYQLIQLENQVKIFRLIPGNDFKLSLFMKKEKMVISGKIFELRRFFKRVRYKVDMKYLPIVGRGDVYRRAKEIYDYTWIYDPIKNLGAVKKAQKPIFVPPNLEILKTPQKVRGIPYCWGGYDSIDTHSYYGKWDNFGDAIFKGAAAGNITSTTYGYRKGTAGLDCSGFIGASIGFKYKKKSTEIGVNYTHLSTWGSANKMDIFYTMRGHIGFFMGMQEDGDGIKTLESVAIGNIVSRRSWKNLSMNRFIIGKYIGFPEEIAKLKKPKKVKGKKKHSLLDSVGVKLYGEEEILASSIKVVTIDPGHGTKNSRVGADYEAKYAMEVALLVKKQLEGKKIKVIMTHEKMDRTENMGKNYTEDNIKRAEISNENKSSLYLRIHFDSGDGRGAVYYPEKHPDRELAKKSKKCAEVIWSQIYPILSKSKFKLSKKVLDDNVTEVGKKEGGLLVGSKYSNYPTVLVEVAPLNKDGIEWIDRAENRMEVSYGIAKGVERYLEEQ